MGRTWSCERCDLPFSRQTWRAKCVDCDEFDYCYKCVVECECGQGPRHYVCVDAHDCDVCTMEEDGRILPACAKYGLLELAVGNAKVCKKHRVAAKRRRKELANHDE